MRATPFLCYFGGLLAIVLVVSVAAGPSDANLPSSAIHVELFAADASLPEARIQARGLDGGAVQEFHVTLPWSGTIDIAPETLGAIEVQADGYWSPPLVWTGNRDLSATLIPTGVLWGRIATAGEDSPPAAFVATFRSVDAVAENNSAGPSTAAATNTFEVEGQSKCPIANGIWECELPEGRLDLSLRVAGYAPVYFWDTVVEKRSRQQLASISLIPGASLAGWIATDHAAQGESLVAQVEIRPLELVPAQGSTERRRSELLAVSVKSDDHGFFQATGLSPGTYAVRATKGELRSVEMEIAVPRADRQVDLEEPIWLLPMARLEIQVEPTVDPWNHPWLIELMRSEGRRANRYLTVEKSQASPAGQWQKEGLELGSYNLAISDSQSSTWVADKVEVFADMEPIFYVVDIIPVRGTLEWAGEDLEGEVIFGTAYGAISIRMRSDAEGRFEGSLPHEGEWPLEIVINGAPGTHALEPVMVRKSPGKSYAEVQIELPHTALRGKVVQDGKPVAGAIVLGLRDNASTSRSTKSASAQEVVVSQTPFRREIALVSGKDGTFESLGLSPGEIKIQAYTADAASEWVTLNIMEDSPSPEVVLPLSEKITIRGRLVSGSGGVPGARIFSTPSEGIVPDTQSDVRGFFRIDLQKRCAHVDLLIVPPGAGVVLHRILLHGENVEGILVATTPEAGSIVIRDLEQEGYLPRYPLYLRFAGAQVSTSLLVRWMSFHEEGGYVLDNVTPGVWSLCPESTSPADMCATGEVFAGSETIIVMPAKTGGNR